MRKKGPIWSGDYGQGRTVGGWKEKDALEGGRCKVRVVRLEVGVTGVKMSVDGHDKIKHKEETSGHV